MKTTHLLVGVGLACCSLVVDASPAAAQTCSLDDGCDTVVTSDYSYILSGRYSHIDDLANYCVISGGYSNHIAYASSVSAILGGHSNYINSYGKYNTIGGGDTNYIYGGLSNNYGDGNAIGGGYNNRMTAITDNSFIGGGKNNSVSASESVIGGGEGNTASGLWTMIGGGYHNTASGTGATVLGGYQNLASGVDATVLAGGGNVASGTYSVAVGGSVNTASGDYSLAAGRHAVADQQGCFVWADALGYPMQCKFFPAGGSWYPVQNAFIVRAIGGVEFVTAVNGSGTPTAGVFMYSGASTWNQVSDRNKKHDFQPVDGRDVLQKLAAIPITTWKYNSEESGAKHMGPMAQDLFAAFGLGDDDKHVTSIDEDGIAMAAIQGLHAELAESDENVKTLSARAAAAEEKRKALVTASAAAHERALAVEKELAELEASLGVASPAPASR